MNPEQKRRRNLPEAAGFAVFSLACFASNVGAMDKITSSDRFRKLYPELTEEELKIAEDNFRRYVALALRVYEAICADPERYAKFKTLTAARRAATMKSKSPQPKDSNPT